MASFLPSAGIHARRVAGQAGVTLIELMVSMVIGLVLMLAIIGAYLGSSNASKTSDAQARMHEDAQLALAVLSQQLRMAGYNPLNPGRTASTARHALPNAPYAVRGCDSRFTDVTSASSVDALTCDPDVAGPDSLVVTYEADAFNTTPTSAGRPTDCLGVGLTTRTAVVSNYTQVSGVWVTAPGTSNYFDAENRYYITTTTALPNPSLYCKGNGVSSTAQPLVENIEDLKFSYGTSPAATATATIAGFLSANQVVSSTANDATGANLAGLANNAARWSRVVALRICVVVRSEEPLAPDAASAKYIDCDGNLVSDPPDRRLRKAYATTVSLRNQF